MRGITGPHPMRRLPAALLLAAASLGSGCSSDGRHTITVFAASSLTRGFTQIARDYESANPQVRVRLSFAGSTALGRQIRDGAPADVYAAADPESMALVDGFTAAGPQPFARNRLAIAVRPGNPKGIRGPASLGRRGLVVVVCAAEVPCGRRTDEMLSRAGVTLQPASREDSVASVLAKVVSGEADAAVVYDTDVRDAATRVDAVAIPASQNAETTYPIVLLRRARDDDAARGFIREVLGAQGRRTLQRLGFLAP